MEAADIDHNYTLDGQVVSEEAAKGLGVGKFSTRSNTGFMVRLQAWIALVPMT